MRGDASSGRPALMVWVGGSAIILALAALIAVGAFFVFRYDAAAPVEEVVALEAPTLLRSAPLRAGPRTDGDALAQLAPGTLVDLIGRSADGQWFVAAPVDDPDLVGWLPADAVGGAGETDALAVVAGASGPASGTPLAASSPGTGPTFTPDYPDLAVEAVSSRENRLAVSIANVGAGDVTARVLVSVNGGTPQVVGAKPGEPLRAGGRIEWVLEEEYVQRRAVARVTVSADPELGEEDLENNTLEAIVAPDLPNDIEIVEATNAPDRHLQAVIRNNSPIPIVGPATVTARSTDGTSTLLGRRDVMLELPPGAEMTVDFPAITDVDFTRVQLLVVTESINDAVAGNNVFPR